ncbi:MAG: SprT-like domain-containing protein [Sandaracinaceae bacterium]|nr:SprT-like domain-containing protein [Sandaracinaceae bacterium]
MPAPTKEQAQAFQAMYDHFNRALFAGSLAPVLLNFSRKARTYGFFAPERWKAGEEARHEISLNPSYLAERAPRDVASTLVHEMTHAWQHEHGTPSRTGYHNHQWAAKMEAIGLMPSSTGAPGGARVGQRMSHYVIEGGPFDRAFTRMSERAWFPWVCAEVPEDEALRRKRSVLSKTKYTCPCGVNVWGKPGLRVVCAECDAMFVEGG